MPEEDEPDVVRLTLPGDLQPVLEVAIAVLARRVRLDDDDVQAARVAAGDAFAAAAAHAGSSPIEVLIEVSDDRLVLRFPAGSNAGALTIPPAT
jgi:hypothetical protein